MASFPVPDEYKIVRHVQSVRTYVTELYQSNTSIGCRHVLVVGGCTWPTLACFFVDYVHDKRIVLVNQLGYAMQINALPI